MRIDGHSQLHYIPLAQAIDMTTRYRKNRIPILKDQYADQDILPICETFSKDSFDAFFSNQACKGIRIYYGMGTNLQTHAIIVGVDGEGRDMLPANGNLSLKNIGDNNEDETPILEDGERCPYECPPASPLNEP